MTPISFQDVFLVTICCEAVTLFALNGLVDDWFIHTGAIKYLDYVVVGERTFHIYLQRTNTVAVNVLINVSLTNLTKVHVSHEVIQQHVPTLFFRVQC